MLWDIIGEDNSFSGLVSRQNVTWPELLDHESIITEFRNQNKQLLEQYAVYVNARPQVFPEMLEYITRMPNQQDDALRKFKLPYVSGEVLAIESNLIYEAFFGIEDDSGEQDEKQAEPTQTNLHKLLGYFKSEELNPLLAGYCEKVYNNLFNGRRNKLIQFVFDGYCECLVEHSSNPNVANMLRRILTIEREEKEKQTFGQLRERLLQHLLDLYLLKDGAFKENVVAILVELTTRRLLIADGMELFGLVLASPQLYLDPTCIQIDEQSCRFLKALLSKVNTKQAVNEDEDNNIHLSEEYCQAMGAWLLHCSKFLQAPPVDKLPNQQHQIVQLLGTVRLALIDCLRQAVKMQNSKLNQQLADSNILQVLLELCLRHRSNGILHSMYRGIVLSMLEDQAVRGLIAVGVIEAVMANFLQEDNKLLLGHLTDLFLAVEGYTDPAIVSKLQMPDVITFYEDHILPRKEKKEFKWAGNLENLHAGPHNFVDDQPNAGAATSSKPTADEPATSNTPEQKEQQKEPFDDFISPPQKKEEFNPFAAFAEQPKPKPSDFSAFEDFSM